MPLRLALQCPEFLYRLDQFRLGGEMPVGVPSQFVAPQPVQMKNRHLKHRRLQTALHSQGLTPAIRQAVAPDRRAYGAINNPGCHSDDDEIRG